jgi:hypothetical protein
VVISVKNERIVDSWNKIEPDSAAEARMLNAILTRNHLGQSEKEKKLPIAGVLNWKRLAPLVACLAFVFVLIAAVGNNMRWFGNSAHTADLGGGNTLKFYKSDLPGAGGLALDIDIDIAASRDLTADEIKILFNDMPATAYASFNSKTHSLIRLEGKVGETKIIFAAPGIPVSDTGHIGNENVSEIDNIPVTAGYFVTDANSRGIKNIIYFASFTLGDVSVYAELVGEESRGETLRNEFALVIEQLIHNGTPDLERITE